MTPIAGQHRVMRAMVLHRPGDRLQLTNIELPAPQPDQVHIRIEACGVYRTDLHVIDGDLPEPGLPLIPRP